MLLARKAIFEATDPISLKSEYFPDVYQETSFTSYFYIIKKLLSKDSKVKTLLTSGIVRSDLGYVRSQEESTFFLDAAFTTAISYPS